MMRRSGQSNEVTHSPAGFTLIEILLVMLLISILVLGINAAFGQARVFWSRITETQPVYAQSRMMLDTLRQELSSLYLPKAEQNDDGQQPPALFSVKSGTEITFLTLNPAWNANPVISAPAKVTYTFTRSDAAGTLSRSEQPYSGEKAIGTEGPKQVVLTGLESLQFQVLERGSEDDSWKSDLEAKDKPPQAVKIRLLWSKRRFHDEIVLETLIPILCSESLSSTVE